MATILIVDDRPTNRQLLAVLLAHAGHRLLEAADGAEALALVRAEHPALVITDVLMPTMDGFEFVRQLRADPAVALTPVIFYTAEYQRPETQSLSRAGGVVHHLTKPADPEEILRVVREVLATEPAAVVLPVEAEFDREHRRLLTDKLAREVNRLEAAHRRQAAVAELGLWALSGTDPAALMDDAVALVTRTLDVELAHVLELLPGGDAFRLVAGTGWKPGCVGQATVQGGPVSQAGYTLLRREAVIVADLGGEERFREPPLLLDHGVTSGLTVIIPCNERPFGVMGAFSTSPRTFTRDECDFLQAIANVLATAIERRRTEEALRRSEERLRLAVTGAGLGTWHWDLRTGELILSDVCLAMFGLPPGLTLSYEQTLAAVHPEDRARVDAAVRIALQEHSEYDMEYRTLWPDGTEHWIGSKGCGHYGEDGQPLRMEGVTLNVTPHKRAERALEENAEKLRVLTRRLLEIQEAERRHLARELHDEIGQVLTAVKINIQEALGGGADTAARLEDSISIVDRTLQQVRGMALDLRPSMLDDLGLVAALGWYVERHATRTGLRGRFVADPEEIHADPEIEIACFRVAQEALTNVARHAHASRFSVELVQHAGGLLLVVRDDGVGFDPVAATRAAVRGASLGVAGMRERVELVGGRLTFVSEPGAGAEVQADFPTIAAPTCLTPSHR